MTRTTPATGDGAFDRLAAEQLVSRLRLAASMPETAIALRSTRADTARPGSGGHTHRLVTGRPGHGAVGADPATLRAYVRVTRDVDQDLLGLATGSLHASMEELRMRCPEAARDIPEVDRSLADLASRCLRLSDMVEQVAADFEAAGRGPGLRDLLLPRSPATWARSTPWRQTPPPSRPLRSVRSPTLRSRSAPPLPTPSPTPAASSRGMRPPDGLNEDGALSPLRPPA